jgi:predicted PurR-regulated permease PerM
MTPTDNVLLIILTSLLSILIIIGIVAALMVLKLISSIRHAVDKAESVIDSVESAADVLKNAEGRTAIFKLVKNIYKIANKRSRK